MKIIGYLKNLSKNNNKITSYLLVFIIYLNLYTFRLNDNLMYHIILKYQIVYLILIFNHILK